MRKTSVLFLAAATLAAGAWLAVPAPAEAGGFGVVVRAPHARFAFGIGHPAYPIGYVYPRHARPVFYAPYGYGFWAPASFCSVHGLYHSHFVPVHRRYGRWVVWPGIHSRSFVGHSHGHGFRGRRD